MKRARKIFTGAVLVILLVLVTLVTLPFVFKNKVAEGVKSIANSRLKTALNFSEMDLSFFSHFPHLTVALKNFSLKSSAPFEKDTLILAKEVSFGIDVRSLFGKTITITRVYLDRAKVSISYDDKGGTSLDVYKTDTVATSEAASQNSGNLNIEHINFSNSQFLYSDPSIPAVVELKGLNYNGKSRLGNDILHLTSKIKIDSLNLWYGHTAYAKSQPIEAQLTTLINTRSLKMVFEKNDLKIKGVPVSFQGEFSFRKNGYSAFFSLLSIYNNELFSASLKLLSTDHVWVFAKASTKMDLGKWTKAFGVDQFDLRGIFEMELVAEGNYAIGPNPDKSKHDTVILTIPKFTVKSYLSDGYFKYKNLPQAITGLSFVLKAKAPDENYRNITVRLDELKAIFLKNKLEGYFHLDGLNDLPVDAKVSTKVNLAELKEVIPLDSLELKGILDVNLEINGKYAPEKKLFPKTELALNLADGSLQTKYYPHPLERITMNMKVKNGTGKLNDTRVTVEPLSFSFEGNPFEIRAEVKNPDNIDYSVTSKGTLDVARIYRIFSRKGMELEGRIETDLSLKGVRSDALAGRLEKLKNSGKLVLKNIGFTTMYLPKQFIVRNGIFRFENDNLWFEKFMGQYGASDIQLDGHLSNVVNYLLSEKKLKGSFSFNSNSLLIDEFMAPSNPAPSNPAPAATPAGVIMIPANLEIGLKADLKKVRYQGLDINDLTAAVEIRDGLALLKGMKFGLIGCQVDMDATYGSENPVKAFFDFHVKANDFDVKRAYNEVELFRKMASSASSAEGIISLDYSLKGKLNAGMMPVYPSLEGGGVISLKKVKVMGLKLFTTVSKSTEKEKLKNPDLSKVELKTTIKNNVIILEQTKMKISGFRLRMSGTSNFDGKLALKMRIGLPPLGIIGINLRILGTSSDPKIKYGKGSGDESADATDYTDEMPADMKAKLRNAKDEDLKDEPDPEVK